MKDNTLLDTFGDRWLDKIVTFKLFNITVIGTVIEVLDTVCCQSSIVVAFNDGNKQVKVCMPYQAARRVQK